MKTEQEALAIATNRIKRVENSKSNPNGGYNAKTKTWKAHKSPEGGADTIAWGFKLDANPEIAELLNKQGYITDSLADEYLNKIIKKYYDLAKTTYSKKGYDWNDLTSFEQSLLTDIAYTGNINEFPKLMKGLADKDYAVVKNNINRKITKNGVDIGLGRNKTILAEIDDYLKNQTPQIWEFGKLENSHNDDSTEEVIEYKVTNGQPAYAVRQIQQNWILPNDTSIITYNPVGARTKIFNVKHTFFGPDEKDKRFDELNKKFDNDLKLSTPSKRKFFNPVSRILNQNE